MSSPYGVSTCLAPNLPRAEFLEKAAAAGLRELELGADPDIFGNWLAHPAQARREIEAAGLRVRSVHTPEAGWGNSSLDPARRRAAAEASAECLAPAAAVGAEVVVWHPTGAGKDYLPETASAHRANARESLAVFIGRARRFGLRVAVENLPRRGTPRPLTSVEELLPLVSEFGPEAGICLDAGHANANGLSAAAEVRAAGARLFAVHIQDNDGLGQDQHLIPGKGTTDWPAFVQALDGIGYAGGRIFEVTNSYGEVADLLAALAGLARGWSQ